MRAPIFIAIAVGLALARLLVESDSPADAPAAPTSQASSVAPTGAPAPARSAGSTGQTRQPPTASLPGPAESSAARSATAIAVAAESRSDPPHPIWRSWDPPPPGLVLDPRDLRALADLIAANGLGESSSANDREDGDGVLEPLELGVQIWRDGRLVALFTGEDRYESFGYGMTVLPPSIGDLDALEELDLHTNQLAALPDAVGALRSLRILRLHRNQLEALPESIAALAALRELVVGENALRALPAAIASLRSLEELHANDNPIAALPETIGQLPRLRVLNVSHAGPSARVRLAALPRSLDAMPALETLYLAGNHLFCAGGVPDPALVPARLRDGSIPRLHGAFVQNCGVERTQ